jgi:ribosome-associated protein
MPQPTVRPTPAKPSPPGDDADDKPSKTQLKQQMHALQTLGQALTELPADRLAELELPDTLRRAIDEFGRTRSHEGRRRQMQYIGKLMRGIDEQPLRDAVAHFKLGSARDSLRLHDAERWRAELVHDDEALSRWAAAYPQSDLQRLRSLVHAARRDAQTSPEQRHGRGWRELFQFVKPFVAEALAP